MKNELDYKFDVYKVYSSVCTRCKHFNLIEKNCRAFPVGIPDKLLSGEMKHDKVLSGQKGNTVFEAK